MQAKTPFMRWISPATVGLACLAIGLLAGNSIPRPEAVRPEEARTNNASLGAGPEKTAERPMPTRPKADYAFKFTESTKGPGKKPAATVASSLPAATDHEARMEWLKNLPTTDLPQLVTDLCARAGPKGLSNHDTRMLDSAIGRWWQEDSAGLFSWLRQLPSSRSKHYLVEKLLRWVAFKDPAQAVALAESFKAADPEWDNGELLNSFVEREVNAAWQKPGITADDMLALYARYSRGTSSSGTYMKTYPSDFDFRKFLDGIAALNRVDGKKPARMPPDILQAWAKNDPQAATEWLLQHEAMKDKNGEVSFVEWDDIVSGITARSGPQAYHQWAAGVVTKGRGELRDAVLRESNDQQLTGIVAQIPDTATRDAVLAEAIASSKNSNRDELLRIGLLSTPETRLRAIAENRGQLATLIERGRNDPSLWPRVGLTTAQVAEALSKAGNR